MALPALQLKVTLEEVKVDPGGGLSITAGPVVGGVDVGVGVGVGLDGGVAVGVGVGVGVEVGVGWKAIEENPKRFAAKVLRFPSGANL